MRIRLNKVDGIDRVDNKTRYLVLFGAETFDFICKRIRYLITVKSAFTYVISHNYVKIKADLSDSLYLEKTLTYTLIIIILIKLTIYTYYNTH